jgi:hypothetical protein
MLQYSFVFVEARELSASGVKLSHTLHCLSGTCA